MVPELFLMRCKADSSANHSAGRVHSDSGLIPPDFWQEFNARNVGRPSTASDEAVKELENEATALLLRSRPRRDVLWRSSAWSFLGRHSFREGSMAPRCLSNLRCASRGP